MNKKRILALILGILGFCLIIAFVVYQYNTSPVDKSSNADIEVVIPSGMSTDNIAKTLRDKDLIRNETFFKAYLKLNNVSSLKASTYLLKKSMSLDEIVRILEKGNNSDSIRLTFKEGETIRDYAKVIGESTNISEEEFINTINNREYLSTLISNYWFLTDEILNEEIYYPLEGYLAPDTYEFSLTNLTSEDIITTLLDEEASKLEPYKDILEQGNIHSTLTLASIAELEGVKDEDRKMIISVFNNRLNNGMNLGSDVTTYYAFNEKMDSDLTSEMFNTYNPYNTRSSEMAGRLPIGPICNPSVSSIEAAIYPSTSDYLYFVADKNRNVYFTRSASEHEAKGKRVKRKWGVDMVKNTYTQIKEIKEYAIINKVPIMQDEGIDFLTTFIIKHQIKNVLEIGTAIGYSAIMMTLCSPNIKVTTIERDEQRYMEALKNIKKLNLEDRITPIFNDALNVKLDDKYDLIFIDAAKAQNIKFFELFERNLNPEGYIITDNMYFHGLVKKNEKEIVSRNLRGIVRKIKDYITFLKNNDRYNTTIYDVGDGIAVSEKKTK